MQLTKPNAGAIMYSTLIAIGLAIAFHSSRALAAEKDRPNVLFIAVDDLKPTLGCYGHSEIHSPNIDRLANRGTVFLNAHCQQAVCAPSRVSLLTGLRPDTTRVYDLQTKFRDNLPDVVTLPQHFKQHGYHTVGMGKIFDPRSADSQRQMDEVSWSEPYLHPHGVAGKTVGYLRPQLVERIEALRAKGVTKYADLLKAINKPATDAADVADEAYDDGAIAKRAVGLIKNLTRQDKPFFLAVGFKKPHLPFNAPQKYWDLYDRDELALSNFQKMPAGGPELHFQDSWELRSYDVPKSGPMPEATQRELIHGYYACVSYIDAQVGKLLDAIDNSDAADNTVIILWGDHGWHLGDHGMWCKHTNFEQATRSPLIIAAPNAGGAGGRSQSPVEFVDIFPTLCDLTGVPLPDSLHGTSLRTIMNDVTAKVKPAAISQFPRGYKNQQKAMGYALRDDRYRYIEWRVSGKQESSSTGPVVARELYDYEEDPLETKNYIDDPGYRETVSRMQGLMQELGVGQVE